MKNIFLSNFPFHFIFEMLAITLGFQLYLFLKNKNGDHLSNRDRTITIIAAAVGALLGSRILVLFEHPFQLENFSWILFFSNKTILGGLFWGLIFVEIAKWIFKIKSSSGDAYAYPLILAICIGRVGCFLSGLKDQTFGIETSLFTGIDFGDGIFRHPTQLYEIFFLICVFFFLSFFDKIIIKHVGLRFQIFLFTYFVFRLLIEYIKPNDFYIYGFTAIQVNSLFGILYYVVLWILKFAKSYGGKKILSV